MWYGEGDFSTSILLAVNGGYDTGCTAATVGATLGVILGTEGIPARWSEPIGEGVFVGPGNGNPLADGVSPIGKGMTNGSKLPLRHFPGRVRHRLGVVQK